MGKKLLASVAATLALGAATTAHAVPVGFTELTGLTGGTPAGTKAFKADLSSIGLLDIQSITINDNSGGLGGASGQFSGFDLDAITLSTTDCASSTCVAGLTPGIDAFDVFDFSPSGTLFTPGSQRAPTDPKLFGTDGTGTQVDNSVATLGLYDGNSTTGPSADGFLSLGDNGIISFNLTSSVAASGLNLYIGEVGDNGEVAAGNIEVFDRPVGVPAPAPLALLGIGLLGIAAWRGRAA